MKTIIYFLKNRTKRLKKVKNRTEAKIMLSFPRPTTSWWLHSIPGLISLLCPYAVLLAVKECVCADSWSPQEHDILTHWR